MSNTIDPELLMAYADGELDPVSAKRLERAIANEPDADALVARHRELRETLARAFDPIATEPVPERLRAAVAPLKVVNLAAVRAERQNRRRLGVWSVGGAMVASLALGLILGGRIGGDAPFASQGGMLVASGNLEHALDTQLASDQDSAATTRMLVSFRDQSGAICRTFTTPALGGIACRNKEAWVLRETRRRSAVPSTEYRQASSGDAALMAEAEATMSGEPFNAATETRARQSGWR